MGLDMYLEAEKYVSGYDFRGEEAVAEFDELVGAFDVKRFIAEDSPHGRVGFTVGYWRKANAVHKWFVENVQGGKDDCNPYYVERSQLEALRAACQKVIDGSKLKAGTVVGSITHTKDNPEGVPNYIEAKVVANPEVAEEVLPTTEGFFFGSTGYDEWYVADLKRTIEIIDRVLEMPTHFEFYYRASW